MDISCFWEHNGNDTLLYAIDCIGSFTRGKSKEIALAKMPLEIRSYLKWTGAPDPEHITAAITQEKESTLTISDADSDAIFQEETLPLTVEEYQILKHLALKSAKDFHALYAAMPTPEVALCPERSTFYGNVPRTPKEMYLHTKNVNAYYFGEIGVESDNEGSIYECRQRGFQTLEQQEGFLSGTTVEGSYGELWSLRKVLRRFIWHDRIHAKAMYRLAKKAFNGYEIPNPFFFL